ncbi:MAG: hypothetical protein FJY29_12130 [Betaproteobacteria bacterium]|nr:hypothetical protein [Betaproteobacteria bacterium]
MEDRKHTAVVLSRVMSCGVSWLIASVFQVFAFAQRGQDIPYRTDELGETDTASSGIPGVFDTELSRTGEIIGEFPSFALDYGINDRWTIGTNAISTVLGLSDLMQTKLNSGVPYFFLKSRHAVFADSGWKGTLTGYFLAVNSLEPTGEQKTLKRNRILAGTINISKHSGRNVFGLSSAFLHQASNRGDLGMIEQEHERSIALAFTPLWKIKISHKFDAISTLTICPYARFISSNPGIRKDATSGCLGENALNTVWRTLVNWRSSPSWLFTLGAFANPNEPQQIFPYFGLNTAWQLLDSTPTADKATEASE